jgi:hypothetical protein
MSFGDRSKGRIKIRPSQLVVLEHDSLEGADFSGRKLLQFAAVGARLKACKFENVRIESAAFGAGREVSEYINCNFDGARIQFAAGGYSRFVGCSFREAVLTGWFCFATELVDCTFTGRIRKAVFNGTVPEVDREVVGREKNEFHGNDFSGCDLVDVGFRTGIDLSRQLLPTGPEYLYLPDAQSAIAEARKAVVTNEDLEFRADALILLGVLEKEASNGQRQLLLRHDEHSGFTRKVSDAVFSLLR